MFGKLARVGRSGLTQLGIWIVSLGILVTFLSTQSGSDMFSSLPYISPLMIFYFLAFFLIGYFIYASIYALIGAMVTNVQEGGQFALPATMLLVVGYLFTFAVIRDPNSSLSFWLSLAPFLAPIIMPVRILAEMPPLWQIIVSMAINLIAIAGSHLARRPSLSRRHAHVWQTRNHSRSLEMDPTGVIPFTCPLEITKN